LAGAGAPVEPWFYNHYIFCVCFDVMYSGEYNVFDVTLSVYPHREKAGKLA
jgi:hypothetical protein